MLSPKEAERELSIGAQLNPGPWIKHSMSVGLNAKLIADKIDMALRHGLPDFTNT
ncbi:hypothetical protein [Clostridium lacusfryxellense]|uniref:hypothetical protein n=1 Tax=Clostridium lacusfryxellense TaxID=205328 RepID=UPI001C0C1AFA|nr:hypothetical protein [Clostridium lacusfryxellense]MBU3110395.1 hypothetical protein [Clostridium lacusfryxellense]